MLHTSKHRQLLSDIQLLLHSTVEEQKVHTPGENGHKLVFKLHSYLPSPLSDAELEEVNILEQVDTQQSLLALLYEELCCHNRALISIHASLQELLSYFKGDVSFTAEIGQTLTALSHNTTPPQWKETLAPLMAVPTVVSLIAVVRLLRSRMTFYVSCLQSGTLPRAVNPLWFSSPADLLSRVFHEYTMDNQLPCDEAVIRAIVREFACSYTRM